jgi:hypothetical protein
MNVMKGPAVVEPEFLMIQAAERGTSDRASAKDKRRHV